MWPSATRWPSEKLMAATLPLTSVWSSTDSSARSVPLAEMLSVKGTGWTFTPVTRSPGAEERASVAGADLPAGLNCCQTRKPTGAATMIRATISLARDFLEAGEGGAGGEAADGADEGAGAG